MDYEAWRSLWANSISCLSEQEWQDLHTLAIQHEATPERMDGAVFWLVAKRSEDAAAEGRAALLNLWCQLGGDLSAVAHKPDNLEGLEELASAVDYRADSAVLSAAIGGVYAQAALLGRVGIRAQAAADFIAATAVKDD